MDFRKRRYLCKCRPKFCMLFLMQVSIALVTISLIVGMWESIEGDLTPLPFARATDRLACTKEGGCEIRSAELRITIVGDTGGLPIYPHYTYAQSKVAKTMAKVAQSRGLDFVVNVGDNFYMNGVKNVHDKRFESSFEDVYTQRPLAVPWYIISGNHDHLGNVSAQVKYTDFSNKWTYPELFYKVQYRFGDENNPIRLEILMIDTMVLCGNTIDVQGDGFIDWVFNSKKLEPTGPPPEYKELATQQWRWIEQQLAQSTADYLFVIGHYPILSVSEHGGIKCMEPLDALLRRYKVNAYIAGHDHNLQHIRLRTDGDEAMNYIISGAASRTDRSTKHIKDVPDDALLFRYPKGFNPFSQLGFSRGGFVYMKLSADNARLEFYSGKGDVVYQAILMRRNQKLRAR